MRLRVSLLALPGLLLATACGGDSGVQSTPAPPASPAPTPSPPPPPPPPPGGVFNTAEYQRSGAAVASGAISAWNAGADGTGVVVADVDSGIDAGSPEFAGRIHPLSQDVTGSNRGVQDTSGHGTSVSAVMVAARNNNQIVGVAPGATLLVARADTPDSCGEDGCSYFDRDIAAGVNLAVQANARAINISLGGEGGVGATLARAAQRATAAGAVIAVSAGNDGKAEVDSVAAGLLAAAGASNVIVVGAVDAANAMTDFSNRAGVAANSYLVALGSRVRSFDETGTAFLYSGTSYAAPQVTAAAALLAQAFPNLTGPQIVQILLRSATDLGEPGTDAVFGRGALNIAAAMQPIGQTSLAGGAVPVTLTATGSLGPAMGDGARMGAALGRIGITDEFRRDFVLNPAATLRRAPAPRLAAALLGPQVDRAAVEASVGTAGFGLSVAAAPVGPRFVTGHAGLDGRTSGRPLATLARLRFGGTEIGVANGHGVAALLPGGAPRSALVAADALEVPRGTGLPEASLVVRQQLGGWDIGIAAGRTRLLLPRVPGLSLASRSSELKVAAARRLGPVGITLHAGRMSEDGSMLGMRLAPWYGLDGGDSAIVGGAVDVARGSWSVRLAGARGWTTPRLGGGVLQLAGAVRTGSWSAAVGHDSPLGSLTLGVAQPLRVDGGALALALPGEAVRLLPMAAEGREVATELGWSMRLAGGQLALSLFDRRQPGHIADMPADQGGALRFRIGW